MLNLIKHHHQLPIKSRRCLQHDASEYSQEYENALIGRDCGPYNYLVSVYISSIPISSPTIISIFYIAIINNYVIFSNTKQH